VQPASPVESDDGHSPAAFVGRQRIFDNSNRLFAYELLFRSGEKASADHLDDQVATSLVIYNALMEIGLDDLVGNSLAFVNFSRETLLSDIADLLPPSRVVIEILEDTEIDDELNARAKDLVDQGYAIALDDFIYSPEWDPLLRLAKIVKIDVACHTIDEIQLLIDTIRPFDVELLAEKVETHEEHEALKKMGFRYFQGYYYAKPSTVKTDHLPDNHLAVLQLVARLQDSDVETTEAADLLSQTVSLNYQLLRYVNSAATGLRSPVSSVKEAVVYLGLRKVKQLASLVALSGLSTKPVELIYTGLTRAMTCELLASRLARPDQSQFFLVGLFSILEALLDCPIETAIRKLPLTEELVGALVNNEGILAEALRSSIACETGDWEKTSFRDLDARSVYSAHVEAIRWARTYSN
jgi:EAL and modified HD-GYP domain-containing signal transduction protein